MITNSTSHIWLAKISYKVKLNSKVKKSPRERRQPNMYLKEQSREHLAKLLVIVMIPDSCQRALDQNIMVFHHFSHCQKECCVEGGGGIGNGKDKENQFLVWNAAEVLKLRSFNWDEKSIASFKTDPTHTWVT